MSRHRRELVRARIRRPLRRAGLVEAQVFALVVATPICSSAPCRPLYQSSHCFRRKWRRACSRRRGPIDPCPARMIGFAGCRCQPVIPSLRRATPIWAWSTRRESRCRTSRTSRPAASPGSPSPCASPSRSSDRGRRPGWTRAWSRSGRRGWWRSRWHSARAARRRSTTCGRASPARPRGRGGTSRPPSPTASRRRAPACRHAFPGDAVGAGGIADPGVALGLAGVPHVIAVAALDDHGPVDVVLPAGFLPRAQHDPRRWSNGCRRCSRPARRWPWAARRPTCGTYRLP